MAEGELRDSPGNPQWPDGQPVTPWADPWHDIGGDIASLYVMEDLPAPPLTLPAKITCQCDVVPERPCPAPITQEDLLCDTCREARRPGFVHGSSAFTGSKVVIVSHFAIPVSAVAGIFTPEGP